MTAPLAVTAMVAAVIIAQLPGQDSPIATTLVVYGPMGVMLAWFAFRAEQKLDRVVDRLDLLSHRIWGMTKAMLAEVVSREGGSPAARKIAQEMLDRSQEPVEQEQEKRRFRMGGGR